MGVNLRSYDFSQLYLRQLYLRGVNLPQINFAQAAIIDSVFTEPFGIIHTAVFSPDGQYLAAGTSEGAIYLWRTADQQLAQVIPAHSQGIDQLAFAQRATAQGNLHLVLASASDDKSVGFWSLAELPHIRWHIQLSHEQQESVLAIGFSPDGQRVTSVDSDGRVFVWDVRTRPGAQLIHHFATHPTRFGLVAFSGDGQTVAVGQRDGAVQLWNLTTGEAGLVLTGATDSIVAVAFSRDGQTLVTGGKEGQLCLWTLPAGHLQHFVETKSGIIDALAFSPDGKILASTHWDRAVRLWVVDAQTGLQLRHTLLGHSQVIWSVSFDPRLAVRPEMDEPGVPPASRQLLVTGSSDQTVRVWDAATGQSLYTLRGQPRALAMMAISPLLTRQPTAPPETARDAPWLLAAVCYDRVNLCVARAQARRRTGYIVSYGEPRVCPSRWPLHPNAHTVASAGSEQVIDLWDVASGQRRQTLHGHTNSVLCLAFHPAGDLLASGSTDGTVRLWSLRAGGEGLPDQPVTVLAANPNFVYDLAFSPDGRILASVGAGSRATPVGYDPGSSTRTACRPQNSAGRRGTGHICRCL